MQFTGSGLVTGAECLHANREVIKDSRLATLRLQIVDLTAVERYEISAAESRNLAAMDSQAAAIASGVRVAMICPDDLVYGMSRLYAGHASPDWQVEVFRHREEALQWLGLEQS
ncbi:MAG TPA: hypothetical protein DCF45_05880 [Gammaproteobacteria bacterium]|nr:hypothetical protein [Gammaproteobacteria bacterium]